MFELNISCHNQFCIEISNPSKEVRDFLRSIVCNQWFDSDDYKYNKISGAFLQCDYPDFILIEFWKDDGAEKFVEYANKKWESKKVKNEIL